MLVGIEHGHFRGKGLKRGSALIMALLALSLLFTLGVGYLSLVESDNRQGYYQARNEQAWYVTSAGLEFYRAYCTHTGRSVQIGVGAKPYLASGKFPSFMGSQVAARVYLPRRGNVEYFDIVDRGAEGAAIRGVVLADSVFSSRSLVSAERIIMIPCKGGQLAYDGSLRVDL